MTLFLISEIILWYYVAQSDIEFILWLRLTLNSQPQEHWDYKFEPLCQLSQTDS